MYKAYFSRDFPDQSTFNKFYAPNVRSMDIYNSSPNDGSTNLIIAINDFELLLFPFTVANPQVWCNTISLDADDFINQELKFHVPMLSLYL